MWRTPALNTIETKKRLRLPRLKHERRKGVRPRRPVEDAAQPRHERLLRALHTQLRARDALLRPRVRVKQVEKVVHREVPARRARRRQHELRNRDRERKLIKKIESTLRKIQESEYGYCNGCGIEIGLKRLEARPTATLCIDCKTLDEIREKQVAK